MNAKYTRFKRVANDLAIPNEVAVPFAFWAIWGRLGGLISPPPYMKPGVAALLCGLVEGPMWAIAVDAIRTRFCGGEPLSMGQTVGFYLAPTLCSIVTMWTLFRLRDYRDRLPSWHEV
jgi:hypothetical protein